MAENCKCYSHKVPLRGTFSESPLGPSCEDLRPSCMVFNTNRLFEPFYVFDALNLWLTAPLSVGG